MLAEISLFGALAPSLLLRFVAALGLFVPLEWLLLRSGFDRLVWHPPLAHCGLFLCLFTAIALLG
jgi:hypothetical protein